GSHHSGPASSTGDVLMIVDRQPGTLGPPPDTRIADGLACAVRQFDDEDVPDQGRVTPYVNHWIPGIKLFHRRRTWIAGAPTPDFPQLSEPSCEGELSGVPDGGIALQQRVNAFSISGQETVVDGAHTRPDLSLVGHSRSFGVTTAATAHSARSTP